MVKKCHEVICVNPPCITYNFISPVALLFLDQDIKLTVTYFINWEFICVTKMG